MTMRPGAIVAGVILLGVGTAMLLDNTGMLRVQLNGLIAPLVLITMGSLIVLGGRGSARAGRDGTNQEDACARKRRGDRLTGGFWFLGVGVWLLVSKTHLFGLEFGNSWPLLIIIVGLIVMMRGAR
jgi:hypothetical protein